MAGPGSALGSLPAGGRHGISARHDAVSFAAIRTPTGALASSGVRVSSHWKRHGDYFDVYLPGWFRHGGADGPHGRTPPIRLERHLVVPAALHEHARPGLTTPVSISGNAVTRIVKNRAAAAGFSVEPITAHSLRAGHRRAALAGVGIDRIAAQTRRRRIDILVEHYIRPVQAPQTTSGCDSGLTR